MADNDINMLEDNLRGQARRDLQAQVEAVLQPLQQAFPEFSTRLIPQNLRERLLEQLKLDNRYNVNWACILAAITEGLVVEYIRGREWAAIRTFMDRVALLEPATQSPSASPAAEPAYRPLQPNEDFNSSEG